MIELDTTLKTRVDLFREAGTNDCSSLKKMYGLNFNCEGARSTACKEYCCANVVETGQEDRRRYWKKCETCESPCALLKAIDREVLG